MRSKLHLSALCALLAVSSAAMAQDVAAPTATPDTTETPSPAVAPAAAESAAPATAPAGTEAAAPADTEASASATTAAPEAAAPAAAATSATGLIGAPQSGKGQIVFFREKKFAGAGVRYKVREGTNELGKLSSGTYFVVQADPGAHEYTVHSEAKDVLNMEIEAGETYYVQGTVTMGFMVGHPNLSPSDETTFDGMAGKLRLAK